MKDTIKNISDVEKIEELSSKYKILNAEVEENNCWAKECIKRYYYYDFI